MKEIILDTETTDRAPGQIAQLTYIIQEDDKFVTAKNFFFTVNHMDPEAEATHGFSIAKLRELSQGKRFYDYSNEIAKDLSGQLFIAHNAAFDYRFVQAEFNRLRKSNWQPSDTFCTMKHYKPICNLRDKRGGIKQPKLEETLNFLGYNSEDVLKKAKELFNCNSITFHDARFDTTGLMMIYNDINKSEYKQISMLG